VDFIRILGTNLAMQNMLKLAGEASERVKMADIARLAGVSVATVSRALAGSTLVTAETRQRIEAAVNQTGYVVNHVAARLRQQRSQQILVLLPTIANPFFAEVVLGIEAAAQAKGFSVLVGSTGGSAEREAALTRHLLTGAVDGLILLTGRLPALDGPRAALEGPLAARFVAVSEHIPGAGIATVSIDNVAAAGQAVRHLIELGHRRIAHIGGPAGNILTAQRLRGYRLALAASGLAIEPALVTFGDFTFASGEAAMRLLLAGAEQPSAVFCSNDEMAIGAINAAKRAGLAVPGHLSVVGFDDIPFASAYDPPLTTIRQPRHAFGREAATLLMAALAKPGGASRGVRLPYELIVRRSTARLGSQR
jgi:LacI family repressor for deo operon, udp, cdd, tsx, nupC, and nupG